MHPIMNDNAQAALAFSPQERLERLGSLTTSQRTFVLTFLAGYAPAVFDAVIDVVEPCNETPDLGLATIR
jgi:hypothetical protein